jgi:hypothetical protein
VQNLWTTSGKTSICLFCSCEPYVPDMFHLSTGMLRRFGQIHTREAQDAVGKAIFSRTIVDRRAYDRGNPAGGARKRRKGLDFGALRR